MHENVSRRPSRLASALCLLALCLATAAPAAAAEAATGPIPGFSAEAATAQHALEDRFDQHLDAATIGTWIEKMSAEPHPVGSPGSKAVAEWMVGQLRSWGWDARLEEFEVLFPVPKARRLELLAPTPFTASLAEGPVEGDPSTSLPGQLPIYNAYSIDGDVTGELVFVNYGVPADYEELEKRGIDVTGKIVIAKYGGSWRGIKPKVAAERGAIGCIIYSDPADDGYAAGDVYPEGGFRPPQGAQRGSVADMPLYPGDPLTPGVGATADAKRLPLDEAETLTKIPVLPISYQDAQPLLAALGGPVAPQEWRGALPITYHLGPGPATVRLALEFHWDLATAYDVIAVMEGAERPDEWILRGNHHDAWVFGATDPVSGMAAVLAEARAIGALAETGWRPRRTLVYAGWDAEEPGLLGSTEWAERHAEELRDRAVVYINTDSNGRGFLSAGGSHALEPLVTSVAEDVTDPEAGISLADRRRAVDQVWGGGEARERARSGADLPLSPLGSGSDYTPFFQHLGIASLNLGFYGQGDYGQYHSAYDTFEHYRRFMDPEFAYGVALAQVGGRLVLRLSEAELLPFDFTALASTVGGYVDEVRELADSMRTETAEENRRIEEGLYAAIWDTRETWVVPEPSEPVPYLDFAPLQNAHALLEAAARRHEAALAAWRSGGAPLAAAAAEAHDEAVQKVEQALTREEGLPGRPWYVHHVYAPGFYTGYGVKTLPAVREAIEQREWQMAEAGVVATAEALRAAAAAVDRAAEALAAPTS